MYQTFLKQNWTNSVVQINGKTYQGNNVVMNNGTIIIDGITVEGDFNGSAPIQMSGDIHSLRTDGSATVDGNVQGNVNAGGSLKCGNIEGSANAGGSLKCGDIQGSAMAGGSLKCNKAGTVNV